MPNKIELLWKDIHDMADRWERVAPFHTHKTLNDFLGQGWVERYSVNKDAYFVSEATYKKMQLLLGPHYKTIIKAWFAKQEYLTDDRPNEDRTDTD